ncbi:collagen-binding domain-containing protein, partial [Mumia xiangluensis]
MRTWTLAQLGAVVGAAGITVAALAVSPASAAGGFNPVRIDDDDPANSSFLVFIERDVLLAGGESEGTIALGGDLTFANGYNVMLKPGSGGFRTPTAPGDANPTTLYVGGDVAWSASGESVLRTLDGGFTKIGGTDFTALDTDSNGASVNTRIVRDGGGYESVPRIEGTARQAPESVGRSMGELVDVAGAFPQYRDLSTRMGRCEPTLQPTDANGNRLPSPIPSGSQAYLNLVEGTTNVLDLTADELAGLASFTVRGSTPREGTTLLINVAGESYTGPMPNQAGVSGTNAPWILWNFPEATEVTFSGGDSVEGTLYAPRADLRWRGSQNIEGNVVAKRFEHGSTSARSGGEIHDFPFRGTIDCGEVPTPTPTPTPTATPTPTDPTSTATGPTATAT